jgi:signal transduction histidine kinase
MKRFFVTFLVLGLFVGTVYAASEKDLAVSLVDKAAALAQTQGVIVAHPKNPKLIGKNLLEVPDPDGKFFRKEIQEVAKTKGTGWVDYKYTNPETKKVELKTTYLKKVGDLIICCGIYK